MALIPSVFRFIRQSIRKKLILDEAVRLIFGILIFGFLLHLNVDILRHGGIYLLHEKEADAVEMQGYISAIMDVEEAEGYDFPNFGSGPVVQCTINDVKCIVVDRGSLEEGDYVLVKYLPKSRYVLYIGEVDEESEATRNSP